MRDTNTWCRSLEKRLRTEWRGVDAMPLRRFLQVELGLFLVVEVCPDIGAEALPPLLTGYPFVLGHDLALSVARVLLAALKNPTSWQAHREQYRALPEQLRGFDLTADGVVTQLPVTPASERFDVYRRTLSQPLPYRRERLPWAKEGTWRLRTRAGWSSVRIPAGVIPPGSPAVAGHSLPLRRQVPDIDVRWDELLATARWMDEMGASRGIREGHWERRLRRVRLECFDGAASQFEPSDRLRVSRVLHMVGMVSSGKSTLMDVLAVWAARAGRRTTLVVGDVPSAVRRTTMFRQLGIPAAPILGRHNRRRHAERLHRLNLDERAGSPLDMGDPAFDFLSTACALDALREHEPPFDPGASPCETLHPPVAMSDEPADDESQPHVCPFYGACQQHEAARALVDAAIWVATPAALVYTQVPGPISPERIRYAELVYRTQDLVIVDEADQVQVRLDIMFSPSESLFGGVQGSWFDELEERVGRELRASRRRPLSDADVGRWVNAVDVARAAGNRLYALLNQHAALRSWVERRQFTEWSLANSLAREWTGVQPDDEDTAATKVLLDLFRTFNTQPFGEPDRTPTPLVALAQRCLTASDDLNVREELRRWIQDLPGLVLAEGKIGQAAVRLELTLLVAILANRLEVIIRMWRQVEIQLRLDGNSVLFHRPPEDFRPVVPDAPMGNQLGFQYLASDADKNAPAGELRFFRCMGVGRWMLLNLHRLFDADGTQGPNVLLLSGTSWAGEAPGYHVQMPVEAVLRAPQEEVEAIRQTHLEFRPFFDPKTNQAIRVSGAPSPHARSTAVRSILSQLAGQSRLHGGPSLLERDILSLPPGRRRVLLLVGSYSDARQAFQDLLQIQPAWSSRVAFLIPDDEEEGEPLASAGALRRADVERFGRESADILIAPLLAVERGHNILNEEQRAAVGAVYLLVRPLPRPDDMNFAIFSINRWAVERATQLAELPSSVAEAGRALRADAFSEWRRLVATTMSWSSLDRHDRVALSWNQLVTLWQVIGRLVRGGEPARVYFCDAAFAPDSAAGRERGDTKDTSLLVSLRAVLDACFTGDPCDPRDLHVAEALYGPLRDSLSRLEGVKIHGV